MTRIVFISQIIIIIMQNHTQKTQLNFYLLISKQYIERK
jgi:hypothetical protein